MLKKFLPTASVTVVCLTQFAMFSACKPHKTESPQAAEISQIPEITGDMKIDPSLNLWQSNAPANAQNATENPIAQIRQKGKGRFIIIPKFPLPHPTKGLSDSEIAAAMNVTEAALQSAGAKHIKKHRYGKRFTAILSEEAYNALTQSSVLSSLSADELVGLSQDNAIQKADSKAQEKKPNNLSFATGKGTVVAVLDSGVDANHPALAGRVLPGACFSSTIEGTSQSLCPTGGDTEISANAGLPCTNIEGCEHGTHVSGIVAGNSAAMKGVAPEANILPVIVFSRIDDPKECGYAAPCILAWNSDIMEALDWVAEQASQQNIVAVNLSLGSGSYSKPCDSSPFKAPIDRLRKKGIATIIAAGNNGYVNALNSAACVSSAVSVGAIDERKLPTYFTNVSPFLTVFAPGWQILSAIPGGGYERYSGTSMATPHVAGFWALAKSASPSVSHETVLSSITSSGLSITDKRKGGKGTKIPSLDNGKALKKLLKSSSQ
jgi:subtilisin family serine protease